MPDKPDSYPDACVIQKIADLVDIPKPARDDFECRLKRAIDEVRRLQDVKKLRCFKPEKIAASLKSVKSTARKLEQLLASIIDAKITPNTLAGNFLYAALSRSGTASGARRSAAAERAQLQFGAEQRAKQLENERQTDIEWSALEKDQSDKERAEYIAHVRDMLDKQRQAQEQALAARSLPYNALRGGVTPSPSLSDAALSDQRLDIRTYVSELGVLSKAAESAIRQTRVGKGRPLGTTDRPGLDVFVQRLMHAALGCGEKKFTVYKYNSQRVGGRWSGSLIEAVELLRPWLPDHILPKAPGAALERIATDFETTVHSQAPRISAKEN
jgi:hypothetical protein